MGIKAGRQKPPIIAAGGSWTVSCRVKPTVKAMKKTTLSLVAGAGSLSANGSLVVTASG